MVRSPAPAVVVALRAAPGDDVEAGDTIMILEAMKMETPVKAPYAGRVREILASVNSQVDAGGALLRLDKIEEEGAVSTAPTVRVRRRHGAEDRATCGRRRSADLAALRALVMGYDVSAGAGAGPVDASTTGCESRSRWTTTSCSAPRWTCWRPSRTWPSCPATGRPGEEESGDEQVHSPARVLPLLPAVAGPGAGRSAGGLPHPAGPGAGALRGDRTGAEPGAGGGGLPRLPDPGTGRRPDPDHRRAARAVAHPRRGAARGRAASASGPSSSDWSWPPGRGTR